MKYWTTAVKTASLEWISEKDKSGKNHIVNFLRAQLQSITSKKEITKTDRQHIAMII